MADENQENLRELPEIRSILSNILESVKEVKDNSKSSPASSVKVGGASSAVVPLVTEINRNLRAIMGEVSLMRKVVEGRIKFDPRMKSDTGGGSQYRLATGYAREKGQSFAEGNYTYGSLMSYADASTPGLGAFRQAERTQDPNNTGKLSSMIGEPRKPFAEATGGGGGGEGGGSGEGGNTGAGGNRNPLSFKDISRAASKLSRALLDLEKEIRRVQRQFGITAGAAANLKIAQLSESISSTVTVFTSLGASAAVSMREIEAAQVAFQREFGGVISTGAGRELAEQAKELGLTVSELSAARRAFLTTTLGNVSRAIDQQERAIASFEGKGLTAKDAMAFIGQNAELVARAGTRFQSSLMRAAAEAKKIGVDLGKINQVGDNIIGDFEGFLTSMAELGAMGFGFDATRLAEVAESGDTGALFQELQSQLAMTGKDINDLRRSEQLALSQAFGMDIAEFQRMAGGEVTGGGESMEDLQKKSNALLERLVNLFGAAGTTLSVISTILSGVQTAILRDISRKLGSSINFATRGAGRILGKAGRGAGRLGTIAKTRVGAIRPSMGGVLRGTGIGMVAGFAGGALETGGEALKERGNLKTGSAISAIGTAGKFAGYGAMLGSIVPGVGTAVGAAIGGLIGAIVGITKNFDGFKAMFTSIIDAIKGAFGQLKEAAVAVANFIGGMLEKIDAAFNWVIGALTSLGSMIAKFNPVSLAASAGSSIMGGIINFFSGGESETADDMVSRSGYGERTLVTPQGPIALNNDDNIIAYADDMVSNSVGVQTMGRGDILENVMSNTPQYNFTNLERKLDDVITAVNRISQMKATVRLDSATVGEALLSSENSIKLRAGSLKQRTY